MKIVPSQVTPTKKAQTRNTNVQVWQVVNPVEHRRSLMMLTDSFPVGTLRRGFV